MPGRDNRGPLNEGPMTGRGCGTCNNHDTAIRGQGRKHRNNRGCGFGVGRRLGRNSLNDKEFLFDEKQALLKRLDEIEKKLQA